MLGKTNVSGVGPYLGTVYNYEFTGAVQEFTAPAAARYRIECVGGGTANSKGSKVVSEVKLGYKEKLYVYVGGATNTFNGGGNSASFSDGELNGTATSGSGATDVRLIKAIESDGWSGTDSLASRIVTAGGGGGSARSNEYGQYLKTEDYKGYDNVVTKWLDTGTYYNYNSNNSEMENGILGKGSNSGLWKSSSTQRSYCQYCSEEHDATHYYVNRNLAGGGGWYGGANGYAGTSYVNDGYSYNNREHVFKNTEYDRNSNQGNGHVVITCIGV